MSLVLLYKSCSCSFNRAYLAPGERVSLRDGWTSSRQPRIGNPELMNGEVYQQKWEWRPFATLANRPPANNTNHSEEWLCQFWDTDTKHNWWPAINLPPPRLLILCLIIRFRTSSQYFKISANLIRCHTVIIIPTATATHSNSNDFHCWTSRGRLYLLRGIYWNHLSSTFRAYFICQIVINMHNIYQQSVYLFSLHYVCKWRTKQSLKN